MTRGHLVVTGASTGIGRAIARSARDAGWHVLGTVRRASDAAALADEGIAAATFDVTDAAALQAGAAEILAWCDGRLDGLVHNAGTAYPGPFTLLPADDLRAQLEVNVVGPQQLTARLYDALTAAKGHVMFVSSDSVSQPPPMLGAYAASKRALEALADSFAIEAIDDGVRVSIVRPGPYATAIWGTSIPRGEAHTAQPGGERFRRLGEAVRTLATDRPMGDPADLAADVVAQLGRQRPAWILTRPWSAWLASAVVQRIPRRWYHRLVRAVVRRAERD
jgi:NAD(P)-dependent dehydrogenase (short-subunit alcohol dehydrogenase family)